MRRLITLFMILWAYCSMGAWAGTALNQLRSQAGSTDEAAAATVGGVLEAAAQAERMTVVAEPKDSDVLAITKAFQGIFSRHRTSRLEGYIHTAHVKPRIFGASAIVSAIKEMSGIVFASRPKPETIDVQAVMEDQAEIGGAAVHGLNGLLSGVDGADRIIKETGQFTYEKIHWDGYIRVFKGGFGENRFIAFFSTGTNEITLIGVAAR